MADKPALMMQGLRKTFKTRAGSVEALRGLDMEVRRGEVFGYIGVNGAGKSTSIKILLGLIQATGGMAEVFGHPAGSLEARQCIGYLPEVATYHEFMTAEELLRVHARLAGVKRGDIASRCDYCLEVVGLTQRRNSRISEFSKGMKQRFGIAQALVGDPPLLILDELTSGLDPFAQKDLRDILVRLSQRDITVFFSSHHMSEVEAICDRAAIIHRGVLQACGSIPELTEQRERVEICLEVPPESSFPDSQTLPRSEANSFLASALAAGCNVTKVATFRTSLEEVFHDITSRIDREAAAVCSSF